MIYKPENVKLVITHNGVEQDITGFDESTYVNNPQPKKTIVEVMLNDECSVVSGEQIECVFQRVSNTKEVSKKPKSKSSRCKDTVDWVEVEYGDEYKKPKKGGNMLKHIEGTNGY